MRTLWRVLPVVLLACGGTSTPGGVTIPDEKPAGGEPSDWREALGLGFERADGEPWQVFGRDYEHASDPDVAREGERSLRITTRGEGARVAAAVRLPLERVRDRRVTVSGALRAEEAEGCGGLWIRADAGPDVVAFATAEGDACATGDADWAEQTVEVNIPEQATAVFVGPMLQGPGTLWADALQIDVEPFLETVRVAGRVVDADGEAVAGATVTASQRIGVYAVDRTQSNDDGRFVLQVPPFEYQIGASAPTGAAVVEPATYYREDTDELELALGAEGQPLEGKIVLPGGATLPDDAHVLVWLPSRWATVHAPVDAEGRFELAIAKGERVSVGLDAEPLSAEMVDADPPAEVELEVRAAEPAPDAVVDWIREQMIPLETPVAGNGFEDMQPLKQLIGDARVVALGEATHGTREIFQMKHRMFEFLVEELGFTVFAFEASWPESLEVNRYVLTGEGDPEGALAGMHFWVWDTEEVLALIEWMRRYNADPEHERKVKFYGVDMQFSVRAAELVLEYLRAVDPDFVDRAAEMLEPFTNEDDRGLHSRRPEEEQRRIRDDLDALARRLEERRDAYVEAAGERPWIETAQHLRVLGQFERALRDSRDDYGRVRDRAMADNLRWILETEPEGTRVALWAHNAHIQKYDDPDDPDVMQGVHLERALGEDYVPIGFSIHHGTLQARDSTGRYENDYAVCAFEIGPLPPGSWAAAFARAGVPIGVLDLRALPEDGPVADWFDAARPTYGFGAIFWNGRQSVSLNRLSRRFEAVIYLHETSRARPNRRGLRPVFPRGP